jgi:hypothetical protein
MTARTLVLGVAIAALLPAAAAAQTAPQRPRPTPPAAPAPPRAPAVLTPPDAPQPPQPPQPPAPPAPPRREGQPINVKVELTILDQRGGATAARKTVTVVVADNMTGFIRSTSNYTSFGRVVNVPLNVDVEPQIVADNKLRVRVGLQYDLPNSLASAESEKQGELFTTQLRENLSLILENGKPVIAAQSADPVGDRQVTIELKATIMK